MNAMKKKLAIFLLFSVQQPSFGMEYLKSWLGYNAEAELSKEERCLNELVKLKKSIPLFYKQFAKAVEKNKKTISQKNPLLFMSGRGVGDYSHSKNINGLDFDISNENEVMHFTLKNVFEGAENIAELTFNKKLFEDDDSSLLYSHLMGFFDNVYLQIDKNSRSFLDDYLNEEFVKKNPKTVANLKPKNVKKFDSFNQSIVELDEVIRKIDKSLIEAYQNQKNS